MIKLTDYITRRLVEYGVRDLFMISGGGVMHLVDSVGKQKELNYICTNHEQAAAIAAEGYARISGKIGVVVVTSGPGGTNTLTGVIGQWLDSVPCLYLSGQVKFETTIASCPELGLRQLGDQEINIVDIVRPVTKFAEMVRKPGDIKLLLDKAIYLATHGRPGPVWLDLPLDVQGAMIDENTLREYIPGEEAVFFDEAKLDSGIRELIRLLKKAKRPVILAGNGIRISGAAELFLSLASKLKIPVVSSFLGCDLVPTDHPYFIGRSGTIGNRPGNFAVQNSDLLLAIGTRNNIRQVSYGWRLFARAAKKVIVDIDAAELNKPTVKPDLAIHSDAKIFLTRFSGLSKKVKFPDWSGWQEWNLARKKRYPAFLPEYKINKDKVHPYFFINELTKLLKEEDIVVTGNATPSIVYYQLGIIRKNQRALWNSGCASMGYDLPAAIGACFGSNKKKNVICLAGDGSLQMNIQELQTLAYHRLPIKLFILDNAGYASIKQTQAAFFSGRKVGCDPESGVTFPDFYKIARAYGLPARVIDRQEGITGSISSVLRQPGPVVCIVKLTPDYIFSPKLSSERKPDGKIVSKPLEDMYPFLDRTEFRDNMLIPVCEEED